MFEFLEVSLIVSLVLYMLNASARLYGKLKSNRKMTYDLQNERYSINVNATIDNNIIDFLDSFIEDVFNEYLILNIEFREDRDYINGEVENEMSKEIAYIVMSRMSPAFIDKVSLIYNRKELPTIISHKVHMFTMNYVINKNKTK